MKYLRFAEEDDDEEEAKKRKSEKLGMDKKHPVFDAVCMECEPLHLRIILLINVETYARHNEIRPDIPIYVILY